MLEAKLRFLGKPVKGFRTHVKENWRNQILNFESFKDALAEDERRVEEIIRVGERTTKKSSKKVITELRHLLDYRSRGAPVPATACSAAHMWRTRRNLSGLAWELLSKNFSLGPDGYALGPEGSSLATVIIRNSDWDFDLHDGRFNVWRLKTDLLRGLQRTNYQGGGFIIFAVNGTFEPRSGLVRPSVHGVVGGAMIETIRQMHGSQYFPELVHFHSGLTSISDAIEISELNWRSMPAPLEVLSSKPWLSQWEGTMDGVWEVGEKQEIRGRSLVRLLSKLQPLKGRALMGAFGADVTRPGFVLGSMS